ncbi:hypothetical protein PybrP1_003384 [[Pythium] brassicae (nom. inval.)]|nr:hypothetical protein PybrP1_003384 [[Pythium] brassicae (nom. inval.)]
MVRELIAVQVGQCGNQIGRQFWQLALEEHAKHARGGRFDESMSSFFRVPPPSESVGGARQPLKARALLVDMEQGPVSETLSGPLGELFDQQQFITDVSGSGNNWAHGHCMYGPKYRDELLDKLHRAVELCDSLQSFFVLHSMGGGTGVLWLGYRSLRWLTARMRVTGSGLGTYILGLLEEHFPEVYRFTSCVFPSEDDDVITSPYNSVLALRELTEHADCVLPVENEALVDMCAKIDKSSASSARPGVGFSSLADTGYAASTSAAGAIARGSRLSDSIDLRELEHLYRAGGREPRSSKPTSSKNHTVSAGSTGAFRSQTAKPVQQATSAFGEMNNIVARLLTNLTSSVRFEGSLNVDLNEITTNLVPFPKLHFLLSSMSPLVSTADPRHQPRRLAQMFTDAFHKDHQLIRANPRASVYLACGLLLRGNVEVSDVNANIQRLQSGVRMIHWNQEGFKVGMCSVPPIGQRQSLLCLSNNCCIRETFERLQRRFQKLYARKAHVHHYAEFMESARFGEALESVRYLVEEYAKLERSAQQLAPVAGSTSTRRLQPLF